ncbi:MAG: restriction endonuclease subunit S, partial [Clostridiales bacterium]|nr:restriction endonuclease subunit S [Clostridiales bacterium]
TIGLSGLVPAELDGANLTENAAKLCNLRKITKEFLAYTLNSRIGKKQILALIGKAQQPKLALFRIKKIKIPIPPLPEQQKIAEILGSVDKRIEALKNRKEMLEKVKKGLMEDLLTGRKRVNLEA